MNVIGAIFLILLVLIVAFVVVAKPYQVFVNDSSVPLYFIHIPKTAGETIRAIGHEHGYDWHYKTLFTNLRRCSTCHVPPTKPLSKPSFAIVRNPYERAISEYRFTHARQTVEDLNKHIVMALTSRDDYGDCHWLPQVDYTRFATHILRFENLENEFNALMTSYNLPIKLDKKVNVSRVAESLKVSDLSDESIRLINKRFEMDFKELGYQMIQK